MFLLGVSGIIPAGEPILIVSKTVIVNLGCHTKRKVQLTLAIKCHCLTSHRPFTEFYHEERAEWCHAIDAYGSHIKGIPELQKQTHLLETTRNA